MIAQRVPLDMLINKVIADVVLAVANPVSQVGMMPGVDAAADVVEDLAALTLVGRVFEDALHLKGGGAASIAM